MNATTAGMIARTMLNDLSPEAGRSLNMDASHMDQVIGFHHLYGVPMIPLQSADPEFSHMDDERVSLRLGLITEELRELFVAVGIDLDMHYTVIDNGTSVPFNEHAMKTGHALRRARESGCVRDGVEVADALGDLIYVIYGFALEMGYDLARVVEEIHASNLTKLGDDGTPILREDGKVMKGPNYVRPNIPAILGFSGDD